MTPQELKKQAHKEFGERFKCIQGDCDGTGHIPEQVSEDEWTSYQCQFHAEYLLPTKSFLDSLIDKTVQMTEDRIVGIITNLQEDGLNVQIEWDYHINFRDLESLITSKRGIDNL